MDGIGRLAFRMSLPHAASIGARGPMHCLQHDMVIGSCYQALMVRAVTPGKLSSFRKKPSFDKQTPAGTLADLGVQRTPVLRWAMRARHVPKKSNRSPLCQRQRESGKDAVQAVRGARRPGCASKPERQSGSARRPRRTRSSPLRAQPHLS
ncbi:hypothetical protein XACM_2884 [Xanthomonas euvesicatoria pv. citrumelo F1]|nr:hypothetical protein XACM_2884 [Xanthomonas euvesicatoria pv. citrumelo F1]